VTLETIRGPAKRDEDLVRPKPIYLALAGTLGERPREPLKSAQWEQPLEVNERVERATSRAFHNLLNGNALSQISGFINIASAQNSDVISKKLQWHNR